MTLTIPDVANQLNHLESLSPDLQQRSGNCRWIQVYEVQDVSMYAYLGHIRLGNDWASEVGGFECRGITLRK